MEWGNSASFTSKLAGFLCVVPYSAKRWQRKTLANQQNITLVKKTLANNLLVEMSGGRRETLAAQNFGESARITKK